ncbi:DnaJ domain-containing protein [Acidisphaera rubrifaciens]|uniref:DnaJ domain-containing protein n=1 Tax=Acidisphaera rubrifaciens TaxID=50715 RepID=UPI0035A223FF
MTREEAFAVLGLPPGAAPEAIRAAHRRLMRAAHPDSGGSDWIASRINQARDVLLG